MLTKLMFPCKKVLFNPSKNLAITPMSNLPPISSENIIHNYDFNNNLINFPTNRAIILQPETINKLSYIQQKYYVKNLQKQVFLQKKRNLLALDTYLQFKLFLKRKRKKKIAYELFIKSMQEQPSSYNTNPPLKHY